MKTFFNKLANIGISSSTQDKQFITSSNWAVVIAWAITFPYVLIYFYVDLIPLVFINLIMLILYPTVFLLNYSQKYIAAKVLFIFLGYSHVAALALGYPPAVGYGLYFYLMPVISIFIFSRKEKIFMFSGVALFIPFYFFTQYFAKALPIPLEDVPEYMPLFLYYFAVVSIILFILIFMYAFRSSSLFFQDKLDEQKQFLQTLLNSQEQLIITTDGTIIKTANKTFLDFFAVDSTKDFMDTYNAKCVCDTFKTDAPDDYLQINMGHETWIDYVISRSFSETHKVMISMDGNDFIFSVSAAKLPGNESLKSAVFTNITEMENAKLEIEQIHKHTRESIEYASLIQGALIPDEKVFSNYFADSFRMWNPKDIVGGDIYLFEELRDKDECLLLVIDCTGHGVPGAFVTMLVKAIERQITSKINYSDEEVSPAKILSIFNRNMKQLLKQESIDSISNAGLDGGVIYYNKKDKILKFAGAETPLFYMGDDKLKVIKGDRYSVGYKKCDMEYEYKEHAIEVKEGMQFYLTTDGYLDQNGGKKGFPFGKKRFKNAILENYTQAMYKQKQVYLDILNEYQADEERNDDVTFVGFKI